MSTVISDDLLDGIRQRAIHAYNADCEAATIELLARYIVERPDDVYAHFLYGDSLRIIGRLHDAEQVLQSALPKATDEGRFMILVRLARSATSLGRFQKAEEFYDLASSTSNVADLGWVWIDRGHNLSLLGDFGRAEKCYRIALTASESCRDEALHKLGVLLIAQYRYVEASEILSEALTLSPDDLDIVDSANKARAALDSLGYLQSLGLK